ncbi:MAG: Glycosyl transferase, group 2 family [Lachnoclostridium sp.]|jgi:glycosyltransferase involved in cell wall biosynthesis
MLPPLLSYVTFNRLGLTVKNLSSILESDEDFEMHIIDNNSTDGTWKYIQSLKDSRIISKARFDVNFGQVYAINLNLVKRRPDQYFISVDNDVFIETKDWISRFLKVFETFPEVGLLGVPRGKPYSDELPPVIPRVKDNVFFLELDNSTPNIEKNYVPGCCMCLRPELLNEIGYLCEENCYGDVELSNRVLNYTSFKAGLVPNISIKMPQTLDCSTCQYNSFCILNKTTETCFSIYNKLYKNDEFKESFRWKFDETIIDLKSGARPVYCPSANDSTSLLDHVYNKEWAMENFHYYINNAN